MIQTSVDQMKTSNSFSWLLNIEIISQCCSYKCAGSTDGTHAITGGKAKQKEVTTFRNCMKQLKIFLN